MWYFIGFVAKKEKAAKRTNLDTSIVRPRKERQAVGPERERGHRVLVSTERLHHGVGTTIPHVDEAISPSGSQVPTIAANRKGKNLPRWQHGGRGKYRVSYPAT